MGNFSPDLNFNPVNRAAILLRLHDELIICLGTKYEIAREESQEKKNGAENTNRESRRIASLRFWPFGGAQISAFWDGNSLEDDGTEAKLVFGCIFLR